MERGKSVLITAVILAVIAVVIVNVYIRSMESRQARGRIKVVVAKRRLERGRILTNDDVRTEEIGAVAPNVADRLVKANQLASVVEGKRPLIRAVEKNARLLWSHFTPDASEPAFDLVPTGYRGLPLPVDPKTSPGQLLRPGIYVDVLATVPANQAAGRSAQTVTLIERVLVLAVGGRTLHDAPSRRPTYSTVTLQVKHDQAEKLVTINSYLRHGVTLLLRNSQEPAPGGGDRLDEAMRRLGLTGGGRTGPTGPAGRPASSQARRRLVLAPRAM